MLDDDGKERIGLSGIAANEDRLPCIKARLRRESTLILPSTIETFVNKVVGFEDASLVFSSVSSTLAF